MTKTTKTTRFTASVLVIAMLLSLFSGAFANNGEGIEFDDPDPLGEVIEDDGNSGTGPEEPTEPEDPEEGSEETSDLNNEKQFTITYHASAAGMTGEVPVDGALYAELETAIVLDGSGLGYTAMLESEEVAGEYYAQTYEVVAWNTESDGSGDSFLPGDAIEILGNVDLHAEWHDVGIVTPITAPMAPGLRMMQQPMMAMMTGISAPTNEIPGALILDKRAVPLATNGGEDWQWEVTLTVRGLDKITTSDVVLVLDTSGSMKGTKLANMKTAATAFVNNLLSDSNSNTRVAIVSFSDSAVTRSQFTDSKATHASKINGLNADGGTYIQAGIKMAHDLLASSTANNKYIVLLGDGDPTYSTQATAVTGVTYNHIGNNSHNLVYDIASAGFSMTFGTSRTGGGGSDTGSIAGVSIKCSAGNHNVTFPDKNSISTIYQARLAKEAGIELYSIGFGISSGSAGDTTLNSASSGSGYYYRISTDTSSLNNVFTTIQGNIAYAATSAVVTDPMGDMFDKVSDITITPAGESTVSFNPDDETITWNIPKVEAAKGTYTMKYTVKIDFGGTTPYELYPTNGYTDIQYIDVNGTEADMPFPIPEVAHPAVGSITQHYYLVNADGKPVTVQGQTTTDRTMARELERVAFEDPNWTPGDGRGNAKVLIVGQTYEVTAPASIVVGGKGYDFIYGGNTLSDTSPQGVKIGAINSDVDLYFAYQERVSNTVSFKFVGATGHGQTEPADQVVANGGVAGRPNPEPAATGYTFDGWYTDEACTNKFDFATKISDDITLYGNWSKNAYTVIWEDEDGTELEKDLDVLFGTMPSFDKAEPTKAATAEKTYTFAGWTPKVDLVTGDITYTATYTDVTNKYTVIWEDEDGTELEKDLDVLFGTMPSFDKAEPTKAATDEFDYSFKGWTPTVEAVTGDITYTAEYTETRRIYTITWVDENGDVLEEDEVPYGEIPTFDGETPTKDSDDEYDYEFKGWTPEIEEVTGDKTYTAEYEKTPIEYIIEYKNLAGASNTNPDSYNVESDDITLVNLADRTSYSFVGWYTDEEMTEENKVTGVAIEKGSTGNRIFYAKWQYIGTFNPGPLTTIEDTDTPLAAFTPVHYAYIIGYENGLVLPQNLLTRAEAATVFFRLLSDETRNENWTQTNDFSDVDGSEWYSNAISVLSAMEIINGYLDGTFNPNGQITRAELATVAAKFAAREGKMPMRSGQFSDISGHWAEASIIYAASVGWLDGYEDGTFNPNANITRAEFITLVNRMLQRVPESADDLLDVMKTWPDNMDVDAWYYLAVQEATNSHNHEYKTTQIEGRNFFYEKWTELLEVRDWTALEKVWVMANSAN